MPKAYLNTKRVKRLKHGVTVYVVSAFQEVDRYTREMVNIASVEELFVLGRVFNSDLVGHFFPYATSAKARKHNGYQHAASLNDKHWGVPQNYNLHRVFFSRRKAEAYAKLVRTGCDVSQMFGANMRGLSQLFDGYDDDDYDDSYETEGKQVEGYQFKDETFERMAKQYIEHLDNKPELPATITMLAANKFIKIKRPVQEATSAEIIHHEESGPFDQD